MAINYPTSLDTSTTIPAESANTKLSTNHVTAHGNIQSAIIALETKVGITSSADTSSHDYKLSLITGSTKAVPNTNGTLTTPTINIGSDAAGDILYRSSGGGLARLGVGSNGQVLKLAAGLPTWANETAVANASTTVAGTVEEATQAEVEARTATGGTGARLAMTTSNITTVQTYDYAADAVGTDSYAITVTPAPTAYVTGQVYRFKAGTANTGAASLNVNSLGAKTIKKAVSNDLATGDILANQIVEVIYDGTNFQMLSTQQPRAYYASGTTTKNASDASTTQTIAHGLGVAPKYVEIQAFVGGANTSGNAPGFWNSFTTYNGTTQTSVSLTLTSATTSAVSTSFILGTNSDAGTGNNNSGVVTVDATNITITWTKNGAGSAGTYTLLWKAQA